jgi:predicted GNAT family acetyltransferase
VTESVVERIDSYLDQAPRSAASTVAVGPFTLFVGQAGGWPYYARPTLPPCEAFTAEHVRQLVSKQRALEVPESIEAICETAPSIRSACVDAGLTVADLPVLVHHESVTLPVPRGIRIRRLDADDPAIAAHRVVAHLAFGSEGTQLGTDGPVERDRELGSRDPTRDDFLRRRVADATTVVMVAEDEQGVLATGAHQPVNDTSEIVGVATLPSARRRGLGAAITNMLVADALRHGVELVMLSAGSDDVARVYERVGFRRVATALAAESKVTPPSDPSVSAADRQAIEP